jgi:hypothetical protein
MKQAKKVIQRNLPLDVQYTLVGTWYSSIEDSACTCQNCGALIANIAEVKSKYGSFLVGMDCASTLTGVKDSLEYMQHEYRFQQAKQARATVLKALKSGAINLDLKTFEDDKNFYKEVGAGRWHIETMRNGQFSGYNWKQYPAETWQKYVLPMLQSLCPKLETA